MIGCLYLLLPFWRHSTTPIPPTPRDSHDPGLPRREKDKRSLKRNEIRALRKQIREHFYPKARTREAAKEREIVVTPLPEPTKEEFAQLQSQALDDLTETLARVARFEAQLRISYVAEAERRLEIARGLQKQLVEEIRLLHSLERQKEDEELLLMLMKEWWFWD